MSDPFADPGQYGASFADVYDEWYAEPSASTTHDTIAALTRLAGAGPVLELGVGTGRLAIALATGGLNVHGVDASAEMLTLMAAKPGGEKVHAHLGDMAGELPAGSFSLVFVAVNTFFNLVNESAQCDTFRHVATRLAPGGRFAVEAFVPNPASHGSAVVVRSMTADQVVLMATTVDGQRINGQHIELVHGERVRLRPWSIRWATVAQLDDMAAAAGLRLEHRWATWTGERFTDDSIAHVSIYKRMDAIAAESTE